MRFLMVVSQSVWTAVIMTLMSSAAYAVATPSQDLTAAGRDAERAGRYEEALTQYRQASELDAGDARDFSLDLLDIARVLLLSGRYDEAIKVVRRGQPMALQAHDSSLVASFLKIDQGVQLLSGKFDAADQVCQELQSFSQEAVRPDLTLDVDVCRIESAMARRDYPRVLDISAAALAKVEESSQADPLQRLLMSYRADALLAAGDFDEALQTYRDALRLSESSRNPAPAMRIKVLMGALLIQQRQTAPALTLLRDVLKAARDRSEPRIEADALMQIAQAHSANGSFDQAETTHRKALALYQELGDRSAVANAQNALGWDLQQLGRHSAALEAHQQAELAFAELQDMRGGVDAGMRAATAALRAKNFSKAESIFWRVLPAVQSQGDSAQSRQLGLGMMKALAGSQRFAEAIFFGKLALNTPMDPASAANGTSGNAVLGYQQLADVLKEQGRNLEAQQVQVIALEMRATGAYSQLSLSPEELQTLANFQQLSQQLTERMSGYWQKGSRANLVENMRMIAQGEDAYKSVLARLGSGSALGGPSPLASQP